LSLRYTSKTSIPLLPTRRLHLDTHNDMPLTRPSKSCATALSALGPFKKGTSSAASRNFRKTSFSSGTFATNDGQPQPRQSTTTQSRSRSSASPASFVGSSATMRYQKNLLEHQSPFNRTGDDAVSKAFTHPTRHSHPASDSINANIKNDDAIRYKGESTSATGGSQKPLQSEHSRASLSPQETEPTLTPEEYDAWARNEIGKGRVSRMPG